jgi:hypothetical protein
MLLALARAKARKTDPSPLFFLATSILGVLYSCDHRLFSFSIRDDDIGKIKLNRPYHGGLIPSYAEDPAELSEIELLFWWTVFPCSTPRFVLIMELQRVLFINS